MTRAFLTAIAAVVALGTAGVAVAGGSDAACQAVQSVSTHRLVSIPWTKVQPTAAVAMAGSVGSKVRVKIYETLTQDASWRFHNNVLPQLIKTYGAAAGFEIYLHPSADFRNVLASQLVGCAAAAQRLDVMNALFKAMADGTLPHDDANTPEACGSYYDKLYALAQHALPMSEAKFAQCMIAHDGLVHQDAVAKMSYNDGVRRNPAIFVNGQVAYDYDVGAVSRRIDAVR